MSRQIEQMWTKLVQAGLAEGAVPEKERLESPWYVKVLLAFSGWLAALFLLGFLGIGFELVFRNSAAALTIGGMMIGGAYAALRISPNEFVEHLALAISLAGQVLIINAIFEISDHNENISWLLLALLQVPLALIMPQFVHRVFSSFVAALAFSMALNFWGLPYIAGGVFLFLAALCRFNEFSYPHRIRRIQSIGYGLVLALILLKGTTLFGYQAIGWRLIGSKTEIWTEPWMGEVLIGAVMLYVVWHLLKRYGQGISNFISISALLGALLLAVLSMKVQGITVGTVIILLGFAGANRVLMGLGITSLLFYISSYYYMLEATLLEKSLTLLVVGLIMLLLRQLMFFVFPVKKEVGHA